MQTKKTGGLAGIVAGQTAICTVGHEGSGLHYRGYSIEELTSFGSFEETAYLLIYGELPTATQLKRYQETLIKLRTLPAALLSVLEQIPADAHPMDVLRSGCSILGTLEPETAQYQGIEIANRLLASFPSMLLYWYQFHRQKKITFENKNLSLAQYFLQLLHGNEPDALCAKMLDTSFILYAEHEFNASTFAARVTASTGSDFYSAICSAIGTLRGPLHGGANEEAYKLISSFNSAEEAEVSVKRMLEEKQLIMGFGHRVYTTHDPRSDIIKAYAKKLSTHTQDKKLFSISERIEKIMWDEKKLFPNLDFYSASAYKFCNIPTEMFTPIFVMARLSGWTAHILEQRQNNKLIRPAADYIGPEPRAYIEIQNRT